MSVRVGEVAVDSALPADETLQSGAGDEPERVLWRQQMANELGSAILKPTVTADDEHQLSHHQRGSFLLKNYILS